MAVCCQPCRMLTVFVPLEQEGPPVLDAALFVSLAVKDFAKNIGSVDLKGSNLDYSNFISRAQHSTATLVI